VLGDALYLYDVLTAVLSLAVHLTSTLTVDGALSIAVPMTVGGVTLRRFTYGHTVESSPSIASGGGLLVVTVTLADSVTPAAVEITLDTGGNAVRLLAYLNTISSGSVSVNVYNWGAVHGDDGVYRLRARSLLMPDLSTAGPAGSLDYFLGALNTKLGVLQENGVIILTRLDRFDVRFDATDNRIERIEHGLAMLETDRLAAANQLERSAVAAALALERAAANASVCTGGHAKAAPDQTRRRVYRRGRRGF